MVHMSSDIMICKRLNPIVLVSLSKNFSFHVGFGTISGLDSVLFLLIFFQ